MFTGIVEEVGKINHITSNKLNVGCKNVVSDMKTGDSVACNGVCLTVETFGKDFFEASISPMTLAVTNFKTLKAGDSINLERAMLANGRFGGHIVSGHIDTCSPIINIKKYEDFYTFKIELPKDLSKYVIYKGSITINGISLTVAEIMDNIITVAIIPHTYLNTNLSKLSIGNIVNIEFDIFAKYIEKILLSSDNKTRVDMDFLKENGF